MSINYNQLASQYDHARVSHDYLIELYDSVIDIKEGHAHVDLGCGTCKDTYVLGRKVKAFIGIDSSIEMLSQAEQKIPGGTFIQHDLENGIPIDDGIADSVSVASFYHHVFDKTAFFAEVSRILKPCGVMVIITNSIRQLRERGYYAYFPHAVLLNEHRFFTIERLEDLLIHAGFDVVQSEPIVRPESIYGVELLDKIRSPAFDSVFSLLPATEYESGIQQMQTDFQSGKTIVSGRSRYLIVCTKKVGTGALKTLAE